MLYIYQTLAVMLIGISLGAAAGDRRLSNLLPSIIAIGCAVLVFALQAWWPLVPGLVVFLSGQAVLRDPTYA